MSYAPSAFPLVIKSQYVKEPTILVGRRGFEPHTVLRLFGVSTLYHTRYPLASTTIHPGASESFCKDRKGFHRCGQAPLSSMPLHCCGSYHSRLPRYSVGSLPVAPPRPPPLCCEVGNRTRHVAECYHSATHYRHTHIPPKTSIVYISSTVRNRTSSFFENHQRWPLL